MDGVGRTLPPRSASQSRNHLASAAIAASLVVGLLAMIPVPGPVAADAGRPLFAPPFECGEVYTADSYANLYWTGGRAHGPGELRYAPLDFQQPGDADDGDPVLASAGGTVYLFDEFDQEGVGKGHVVLIDHGGDGPNVGWDSYYGHLEDLTRASAGSVVSTGDVIGVISDSAAEPDNHLHYEQRLDGMAQLVEFDGNPVPYWLDNIDGEPGYWAPDERSQLEAATGAVGPWTTPPSTNCGTSTTTTTSATTTTTTSTTTTSEPGLVMEATSIVGIYTASDYTPDNARVLRLYQAVFRREPDVPGAKYWIARQREHMRLSSMANYFAQSEEFRLRYGAALSDAGFIDLVYSNVLERAPDAGGRTYWLDRMAAGLSRGDVILWFSAGAEFSARYPYGA